MKKTTRNLRLILLFVVLFLGSSFYNWSQSKQDSVLRVSAIFILEGDRESAFLALKKDLDAKSSEFGDLLFRLTQNQNLSYQEYFEYFKFIKNNTNSTLNYYHLYDAVTQWVEEPKSDQINLAYVKVLRLVESIISSNGELDLAQELQVKLKNYVAKFNGNGINERKARIYSELSEMTLLVIQRDGVEGLKRIEPLVNQAKAMKDVDLIIATNYYKCEFITILEQDLDEFIRISKECYELDEGREEKSVYFVENLMHLLDAMIYKGGQTDEVLELLEKMYANPDVRVKSYSFYAKLLYSVEENRKKEVAQRAFQTFGVSNIRGFAKIVHEESEQNVPPVEYFYVLLETARALNAFGDSDEALRFMNGAIDVNRAVYSTELANTLANHKAATIRMEAEAEKKASELEIANERKQSWIFIGATSFASFFLLIAVVAFMRQRRQSKVLKEKNEEILEMNEMLRVKEREKSLLVREIHHRVKNNFQIVSSLLDLQVKGVEDPRARDMANEGQRRIRSMAIIHEKLYRKDDLTVNLEDYTRELVREIQTAFVHHNKAMIDLDVDSSIDLDIDTAIPLGLIINELITNAFKYGCREDQQNRISISVSKLPEFYSFVIRDNGSGFDEEELGKNTASIGLHIVRRLTRQLSGKFTFKSDQGALFEVKFKDTTMLS